MSEETTMRRTNACYGATCKCARARDDPERGATVRVARCELRAAFLLLVFPPGQHFPWQVQGSNARTPVKRKRLPLLAYNSSAPKRMTRLLAAWLATVATCLRAASPLSPSSQ
eukprot:15431791-Alexandrium_andersonii.AAC.1